MAEEWDEEGARKIFQVEKFVSLGIDWAIAPTFWDGEGCAVGLDWVPVSSELRNRFVGWWYWAQNRHEPGYDIPDRENPPFPDLAEFEAEGRAIAHAMKRELPDWRIRYYTDYALHRMAEL